MANSLSTCSTETFIMKSFLAMCLLAVIVAITFAVPYDYDGDSLGEFTTKIAPSIHVHTYHSMSLF